MSIYQNENSFGYGLVSDLLCDLQYSGLFFVILHIYSIFRQFFVKKKRPVHNFFIDNPAGILTSSAGTKNF